MDNAQYYEYLKTTENQSSAKWIIDFNDKANIMESMYKGARISGEIFERGFGNYNSKIVFVFKDMNDYKDKYKSVMELIKSYSDKIYEIFVSFSNNTNVLYNEINIIKPKIVYLFCDDDITFNDITSVSISDYKERMSDKKYIFDRFKYLITYQDTIALV